MSQQHNNLDSLTADYPNLKPEYAQLLFAILALTQLPFLTLDKQPLENLINDHIRLRELLADARSLDFEVRMEMINMATYFRDKIIHAHFGVESKLKEELSHSFINNSPIPNWKDFEKRYKLLTDDMIHAIEALSKSQPIKRGLFVGSGPLPLSTLEAQSYLKNIHWDLLDMDVLACKLSENLIKYKHLEKNLRVLPPVKVEEFDGINDYDVIVIAIMVGDSFDDKLSIYKNLAARLQSGKIIITRTVNKDELGYLLYELFPIDALKEDFRILEHKPIHKDLVIDRLVIQKI